MIFLTTRPWKFSGASFVEAIMTPTKPYLLDVLDALDAIAIRHGLDPAKPESTDAADAEILAYLESVGWTMDELAEQMAWLNLLGELEYKLRFG